MDAPQQFLYHNGVQYVVRNQQVQVPVLERPTGLLNAGHPTAYAPNDTDFVGYLHPDGAQSLKQLTTAYPLQMVSVVKDECADSGPSYTQAEHYELQTYSLGEYDFTESSTGKSKRSSKSEASSKSLRFFSSRVCDKVKQKKKTTYNEVADELVQEYFVNMPPVSEEKQQHDVKNIRRRVYDALNVLIALNIVSKEKKEIRWVGASNPLVRDEEKELESYVAQKEQEVAEKENRVRDLLAELVGYRSLVEKNRKDERRYGRPAEDSTVHMPYVMFSIDKNTRANCSISHEQNEVLCQFSSDYEIVSDMEVLRKLGHTYGLESGEVDAEHLKRVRSLVPPGLRHFLPSSPDDVPPTRQ